MGKVYSLGKKFQVRNIWKEIPYSWTGRLNMVVMSIIFKLSHRFNAIPIKIWQSWFKNLCKEVKVPRIAKTIFNNFPFIFLNRHILKRSFQFTVKLNRKTKSSYSLHYTYTRTHTHTNPHFWISSARGYISYNWWTHFNINFTQSAYFKFCFKFFYRFRQMLDVSVLIVSYRIVSLP